MRIIISNNYDLQRQLLQDAISNMKKCVDNVRLILKDFIPAYAEKNRLILSNLRITLRELGLSPRQVGLNPKNLGLPSRRIKRRRNNLIYV